MDGSLSAGVKEEIRRTTRERVEMSYEREGMGQQGGEVRRVSEYMRIG
jgi:hypothetical protein